MSILNTVKNFIGFETDEDYYDDFDEEIEDEVEEEAPKKTYGFAKKAPRVSAINNGDLTGSGQIKIVAPNGFNDSVRVANEVRARRTVIFNVLDLEEDEARRIVDFVAGAVYGVNGNIRRIADRIFVATPPDVNISTDDIKAQTRNSFNWNMM